MSSPNDGYVAVRGG